MFRYSFVIELWPTENGQCYTSPSGPGRENLPNGILSGKKNPQNLGKVETKRGGTWVPERPHGKLFNIDAEHNKPLL